jgi:hypothetical protein
MYLNKMRGPRRTLAPLLCGLLCGLLALAGCTSQADLRKAELADLAVVLPGVYANPSQNLLILNLFVPMLTGNVMYLRETAADDPRRVFSERVWILDVSSNDHIVATVYALEEPEHWRGGAENPELFRPMLQRDLRLLPGCELVWQRTPRGYSASSRSSRCPQSWRLEGEELSFSAPKTTGGTGDGFFHFVRQGGQQ